MPITPTLQNKNNDVDSLTRELLDRLKNRNVALRTELANNQETIAVLEKRLNLQPSQGSLIDMIAATPIENRKTDKQEEPPATFKRNVFFGLTQKDAAVKLLRLTGQPMKLGPIVESLMSSGFSFKSKSPYKVLWKTLSETPEIQKQGPLFGLREWKEQGQFTTTANGGPAHVDPENPEEAE
jgi:hypothetical protein